MDFDVNAASTMAAATTIEFDDSDFSDDEVAGEDDADFSMKSTREADTARYRH